MSRNESETRAELISPKLALDGWVKLAIALLAVK
jgi:hypothetical protein